MKGWHSSAMLTRRNRPMSRSLAPALPAAPARHAGVVALVVGAGIVSAMQVGKVPAALPELRAALEASLAQASWLLSAFAAIGAALGAGIGMAVDAWGARRMAVAGMLVQGVASLLGAMAGAIGWLLALRVAEGIGFLAVVVSAPSLIVAATGTAPARARALAAWSTFMPLGVAAAMLSAPALGYLGWSGMWRLYGLALLAYACWLAWGTRGLPGMAAARRTTLAGLRATVAAPGPRLYATLFGLYTAAYFSIFGFLPSILAERLHVAPWAAGPLAALVVAACVAGNLGGGALLARGVRRTRLMAAGFILLALGTAATMAPGVPGTAAYLACLAASALCGLVPTALLAGAPQHAPRPELAGATMGIIMQGNNTGLLVGPAVAGAIAGTWGWPWVAAWVGLLALAALGLLARLARTPREQAP